MQISNLFAFAAFTNLTCIFFSVCACDRIKMTSLSSLLEDLRCQMARLEFWSVRQLWPALKWNPKRPVLTPKNRVWLPAREVRKMIRELPFRSLALLGSQLYKGLLMVKTAATYPSIHILYRERKCLHPHPMSIQFYPVYSSSRIGHFLPLSIVD